MTRYQVVAIQLWGKDVSINATDTRILDWVETETRTLQPYCKPVRPHIYSLNIRNTGYGYNWRILEELTSLGWEPFSTAEQGTIYLRRLAGE